MDYELDTFSPAHKLSPNRRLPVSSPIQCHEDYTYIHSVTDTCESDSIPHKLSPNRGPTSVPLLGSQQSQVATSRWQNHRISSHKRQVMSFMERLLTVAKLAALFILASAYLGFCVVTQKHIIPLNANRFYAFTPDHIG